MADSNKYTDQKASISEMESLLMSPLTGEEEQPQKWLICLTEQRLAALRKRNKRSQFRRLSVSCRAQCGILLHLMFCRLPFDYFVCRTTPQDLGEAEKLKSVKRHRGCLLNDSHPEPPRRTELILVSNFRSCSSDPSLIASLLRCG